MFSTGKHAFMNICSRQAGNDTTQNNFSSFSTSINHSCSKQAYITNYFNISDTNNNNSQDQQLNNSTQDNHMVQNKQISNINSSAKSNSSLPTYYNNVRCITNKRNIHMKIELSVFKVLCFTETWLSEELSSSAYFPNQFSVYRCDRVEAARRSGGVAILVHRSFKSRLLPLNIETDPDCEFVAVEVNVKPTSIIYYVCYMSTFDHQIAMKHYQRIKKIVENHRNHRVIVLGDFNLHDIIWTPDDDNQNVFLPHVAIASTANQRRSQYNDAALDFLNQMIGLPLYQMSNDRNIANNVLDLLFVSVPNDIVLSVDQFTIIERSQQDHYHIPFEINVDCIEETSINTEFSTVYRYARGNYERICQNLDAINFQHEFNVRNIDSACEFFTNTIKSLVEQNVPKITFKSYVNKPKWWSPQLQRLKNRRDKLYKRKPKGEVSEEYELALHEFNELNERRYQEYILKVQENVKSNPKEFWDFAKICNKSTTYPNSMYYNDQKSSKLSETVDLFADYFESIYVRDDQH